MVTGTLFCTYGSYYKADLCGNFCARWSCQPTCHSRHLPAGNDAPPPLLSTPPSLIGEWEIAPLLQHALQGDRGLVLKSRAKHAAISSRLTKPFHFLTKPLVVQYEVRQRRPAADRLWYRSR